MFSFLKSKENGSAVSSKSKIETNFSAESFVDRFRADFPILSDESISKNLIYVDNSCVTLRPKVVIDAISSYYTKYSACSGRSSHKLSQALDVALVTARSNVAKFIGAKYADEIIFTKNATEAINLVANAIVFEVGDVVVTSHKEHNSNLIPWLKLVEQKKVLHKVIPAGSDGQFSIPNLEAMFEEVKQNGKRIKLVSVQHVSNLDGTQIDIGAVTKCAHKHGALVLIDGCQAVGHMPVEVHKLGVDFYAFSAHKMCGPSGIGALYATLDSQKHLKQFIVGGQTVVKSTYDSYVVQSGVSKFEAGLQDYSGILGFSAACVYLREIGVDKIHSYVSELNAQLTELLNDEITSGKIKLLGPIDAQLRGSIFSFVVPDVSQTEFASLLDKTYGIAVRAGQHCVHSWFAANMLEGSVRVSFHFYNKSNEVEKIAAAIKSLLSLNSEDSE